MIIVKPSSDILQLNRGFRFERNSTAFDEQGKLFYPHNARFQAGKFGKALLVEEGTENLVTGVTWQQGGLSSTTGKEELGDNRIRTGFIPVSAAATYTFLAHHDEYIISAIHEYRNDRTWIYRTVINAENPTLKLSEETTQIRALMRRHDQADLTPAHAVIVKPQIEKLPYPTTFTAGTRSPEIVTIPVNTISPAGGQWDHYVYVNDMARRQVAGQTPTLFHIPRQDGGMGIRVCHSEDTANWKLQTMDDENNITEVEVPDTNTPDGWHRYIVKWTETEAKLLIDGVVVGTIANPALPSVFAQDVYVGSYDGSKDFLNTLHDDIRVSNIARADADDLTDYQADQPLPTDANTIYKQSFDSPNNTYVRQGLVL